MPVVPGTIQIIPHLKQVDTHLYYKRASCLAPFFFTVLNIGSWHLVLKARDGIEPEATGFCVHMYTYSIVPHPQLPIHAVPW